MTPTFQTRARGKLLLTGEYAVLDGALALALPARFGQILHASPRPGPPFLHWSAADPGGRWFQAQMGILPELHIRDASDRDTAIRLQSFLQACRRQNPAFLSGTIGFQVTTETDFPRAWGLGTSSTLIAALARWAGADPYPVLFETLGGSGYDLACAYAEGAILYRLTDGAPSVQPAAFDPPFADRLFFIFLEKKQDSRLGIQRYRESAGRQPDFLEKISALTAQALTAPDLPSFEAVVREHEALVGALLNLPPVKTALFPDYWGEVKSLGAWGGDFVLATSDRGDAATRQFFNEKGFGVFMRWNEMMV